jgi:hypothetical protein
MPASLYQFTFLYKPIAINPQPPRQKTNKKEPILSLLHTELFSVPLQYKKPKLLNFSDTLLGKRNEFIHTKSHLFQSTTSPYNAQIWM